MTDDFKRAGDRGMRELEIERPVDASIEKAQGAKPAGAKPSISAAKNKIRRVLRARLGEEVYSSWFASLDFARVDGETVYATVPVKFLRSWIIRG